MREERIAADAGDDEGRPGEAERVLAIIWPLLGRHIAFHRRLVDLTANVKAALMLSQAIYWTRHGRDLARSGGWFHKTTEQWEKETGLSASEQGSARTILRGLSILQERRAGVPAQLHFRLVVAQLGGRLVDSMGGEATRLDWADAAVIAALLGPSLAFHRTLAGIAGGVHAGLMLSRALHLTRLQWQRRLDAWVGSAEAQWFADLGLSRREQETARRNLERAGVWEETLAGVPPRLMARVRLDGLLARLVEGVPAPGFRTAAAPGSECGVAADRFAPKGESSLRESRNLVSAKPPNQIRGNRHHSSQESAQLLIQRSTGVSVQPLHAPASSAGDAMGPGGGELVFPEALLPEERDSASVLLRRCEDQAQALLDELSGRLQLKAVRTSPIAYLRGLVDRAMAGTFVPELGPRIAAARRRRQEALASRQQREAEDRRLAAQRATPAYQDRIAARREAIRRMLDGTNPRRRSGGS